MPIEPISHDRFKWKPVPWMNVDNILAVWVSSKDGKLSYDLELTAGSIPAQSKQKIPLNRVPLKEYKAIVALDNKILSFDVCGAKGKGIIVGQIDLPIGDKSKSVVVMSTLKDWRDWMENKRFFQPKSA